MFTNIVEECYSLAQLKSMLKEKGKNALLEIPVTQVVLDD